MEAGVWRGPLARGLASAWGVVAARSIARPLVWPAHVQVLAIGGATLGGSGKTPLAIACTRWLAAHGVRAAYVGHAYRARPGRARRVGQDDAVAEVGDEALLAARLLAERAEVVVAPSRQAAVELAALDADVLVLDGVLQTEPRRASLALLALPSDADGDDPWARALPPAGDLRAPREALLAACDHPVWLRSEIDDAGSAAPLVAQVHSRGAFVEGKLLPWSALAPLRLGLFTALARPSRLLQALVRRGLTPVKHVCATDHGPAPPNRRFLSPGGIDLWLASPKCALHLEAARIPHAVLEHELSVPPALAVALRTHLGALTPLAGRR